MTSVFGILTILFFLIWQGYWIITERKADREKPKTNTIDHWIEKYALRVVFFPVFIQLLGWKIFPVFFEGIQIVGFFFVVLGITVSMSARMRLGSNWTHAADYQIKKQHVLVTEGVYRFIRHPIYTGLLLSLTGAELVAQSYLFLPVFIGMFMWSYTRGTREEKLLEEHFGNEYRFYKKRSKMLIPFVF